MFLGSCVSDCSDVFDRHEVLAIVGLNRKIRRLNLANLSDEPGIISGLVP